MVARHQHVACGANTAFGTVVLGLPPARAATAVPAKLDAHGCYYRLNPLGTLVVWHFLPMTSIACRHGQHVAQSTADSEGITGLRRMTFGLPIHLSFTFTIHLFSCKLVIMARTAALLALIVAALALAQGARLGVQKEINSGVSDSYVPTKYKNTKPLIGVLTQPCHDCPGKSYIAAGYVKWIEMGGGRAVPVR